MRMWLLRILSLCVAVAGVLGVCDTFSTTCTVTLGQRLPASSGLTYTTVPADEEFYVTFSMPVGVQVAHVDLSILSGSVRIYAAKNRKPSPATFDYTSAFTGELDFLSIESPQHTATDKFHVLIKASPSSAVYFTGSIISPNQPVRMEANGMPQILRMKAGSTLVVQFTAPNTAPLNVLTTGYSAALPDMALQYFPTSSAAAVAVPSDFFNEDNDPADHFLSFTAPANAVGKTFQVLLTAPNATYISIAVRNGISPDGAAISGTQPQDPPVAGKPTHSLVLLNGQPQRDQVGDRQEHHYLLYVPPGITGTVTIRVDPIQGDSDLYVNPPRKGFYHRNGNDDLPVWMSLRASGVDSVSIPRTDRDYVNNGGAYFITVYGYNAAQFLVRAAARDAATLLVEGYSVQDNVEKGAYKYFRFVDSDPEHSLYFDLLPTVGDADLMVGCTLAPTGTDAGYPSKATGHYNFSSEMYMEDLILIEPGDTKRCSGAYFLAVYGYSDATFMLGAQHAVQERVLVSGLPSRGLVFRAVAQRFKVRVGYESEELRLLLTPAYGDADLYVRLNAPPDLSNYDYQSNNFNTEVDTVVIPESEICANCWVHVMVYGFVTTEFSLLAIFEDGTVSLSNGVPQRGSVASDGVEYYNYQTTRACSLVLVVTATSGNIPALYMSRTVEKPSSTSTDTVVRPANSGSGTVPRVVLSGLPAAQAVHIAVDGAGKNITYTIRVYETPTAAGQPPTLLVLADGMPQEDAIPNDAPSSWLYYQVSAPAGHETIRVRTARGVGYVDIYVRRCTKSAVQCVAGGGLPSETNYTLTTADTQRDFLNIYRTDSEPTVYLVGVESLSHYAAYQISASFENSILSLQAGVSVMDHVGKDEVDYFSFFLDQAFVKLTVSITTLSGDPDLFISTTVTRPAANDRNSTWRSTEYGPDTITIDPRTDIKACSHCTYYIAVVGRREASYTITVSLTGGMPRLVDGVPAAGAVEAHGWVYYTFHNMFGDKRDLHLSLVSGTGNADLYASLDGSIPTIGSHQYGSANWFSNDGVDILHSDTAYTKSCGAGAASSCVVIVGVYGFENSEYTLTLTSTSAAQLLQLGVVVTGAVSQGQSNHYRVLPGRSSSLLPYALRFSVTPFNGHVQLFVSCNNLQPNATNHQWSITPAPGSGSTLEILSVAAADKGCLTNDAQFYATVYGDTAASYSIQSNIADDPTVPMLVPGLAQSGSVANRAFAYYFVRPGVSYDDIRLLATVLQGDVDLYISATWSSRPQVGANGAVQSYLLSSVSSGSEDMLLDHHWVQGVCAQRGSCYLIVGVFGSEAASNIFSLQSSYKDSTLQLSSGVPRRSHVDAQHYEYFKFTVSQPELDVIVSVTPLSGDPDLFISMRPVTHPSRSNFTWFQSKYGADSLTLQYSEMAKHCVPRPTVAGGDCDIFIGVYGWMNTTFTILATVDEGFRSPVTLIDQTPQSGHVADAAYAYYKYAISVPQGSASGSPPTNIKFTLTPTDDGDADLFLLIVPNGNKTEPGLNNYDYRSTGWGSVSELIEISADMPHYCFDCTVYLAVYGYRACSYSIQASSSGLTALQAGHAIGGHVSNERFAYYTIRNTHQFAVMKFVLTMIAEDADLYISPHKPGTPFALPTKTRYQWRSLFVGSDSVTVTYEDPHFCVDCDYIIGVYGYRNSTYTLMATDQEDAIIKLVQNRPQVAAIGERDGTLYFSAVIASSAADMTVTLTSIGTGVADLYVAVYNTTTFYSPAGGDVYRLPDPSIPSSYQYTNAGTEDDHVFIRGPHWRESIVVVLVKATSALRFSIVATSSQSPVLLLAGVPQSHFVEFGNTEFFKYYPHADEDLHITLTARSGDPDLLVSGTSSNPHCKRVTNAYYTTTECGNYTWSSRNYMTDQLILSRDSPCTAVMPSTTVSLDCDPVNSFNPGTGNPIYIGIYGYSAAQFNLLVAPVGQQVQLLAGQPQLSRTSPGFICTSRSPATGACTTPTSSNKRVEVAYFAFRVSASGTSSGARRNLMESSSAVDYLGGSSMQSVFDVMFTVVPACNASRLPDTGSPPTPDQCAPGCDCAPLQVYINSCPVSKCGVLDRKPSEYNGQHKFSKAVKQGTGTSILLSAASQGGFTTFCDPAVAGEDCAYFAAVVATPLPALSPSSSPRLESAVFTITARTPGDMVLIPCVGDLTPDGIQFLAEDEILPPQSVDAKQPHAHRPTHHLYEMCSQQFLPSSQTSPESLIVELEQCSGSTSLFACADDNQCAAVLPRADSWGYFADSKQSCTHSWTSGRDTCVSAVRGKPTLTLPQRVGNYFVMANGTGKFELKVQSTTNRMKTSPQVVFVGMQSLEASYLTVKAVRGNSVTVQWQQARVLLPGTYTPSEAAYMVYASYIFDARETDAALAELASKRGVRDVSFSSACGLAYATEVLPPTSVSLDRTKVDAAHQGEELMTHTFEGLKPNTYYRIALVAICDSACLRQLSKVTTDPRVKMSCNDRAGDCRPQNVVYTMTTFTTAANDDVVHDDDTGGGGDSTFIGGLITFSIVVMVMLSVALVGVGAYWMKNNQESVNIWMSSLFDGSAAGRRGPAWAGDDASEHGSEGARSSHGLTDSGRSFTGFSSLPKVSFGKKSQRGSESGGVELENLTYAPPSAGASAPGANEPIDFRGGAESVGGAVSNVASQLYSAASSAYRAATSPVKPLVMNPMHRPPAQQSRAVRPVGYSPAPQSSSDAAGSGPAVDEVELHL